MTSRRHDTRGLLFLAATLILGSALLFGLVLASSSAPAATTCKVSLEFKPKRSYVNTPVTITAQAVDCGRLKAIVADKRISGANRYPCRSRSKCTIRVTATKPLLVHFTARATKNGKTVESNTIAVRWSAPQAAAKPKTFTMTIKNAAGKIVWKAVQNLATYKTTFTGGGKAGDNANQVRLRGGSRITVSANYDIPIRSGSSVDITEGIWHPETSTTETKTRCKTSTAGKTGCSAKLTLRNPEPLNAAQSFEGHGSILKGPGSKGPQAWISAQVILLEPSS